MNVYLRRLISNFTMCLPSHSQTYQYRINILMSPHHLSNSSLNQCSGCTHMTNVRSLWHRSGSHYRSCPTFNVWVFVDHSQVHINHPFFCFIYHVLFRSAIFTLPVRMLSRSVVTRYRVVAFKAFTSSRWASWSAYYFSLSFDTMSLIFRYNDSTCRVKSVQSCSNALILLRISASILTKLVLSSALAASTYAYRKQLNFRKGFSTSGWPFELHRELSPATTRVQRNWLWFSGSVHRNIKRTTPLELDIYQFHELTFTVTVYRVYPAVQGHQL
jgi:hypothetical protein